MIGVRNITRIAFRKHTHTQTHNELLIFLWFRAEQKFPRRFMVFTHILTDAWVWLFLFYTKRVQKRRLKLKRDTQKDTWKNGEKVDYFFCSGFPCSICYSNLHTYFTDGDITFTFTLTSTHVCFPFRLALNTDCVNDHQIVGKN